MNFQVLFKILIFYTAHILGNHFWKLSNDHTVISLHWHCSKFTLWFSFRSGRWQFFLPMPHLWCRTSVISEADFSYSFSLFPFYLNTAYIIFFKHLKQHMAKKRISAEQLQSFPLRHHNSQRRWSAFDMQTRQMNHLCLVVHGISWIPLDTIGQLVLFGRSLLSISRAHTDEGWFLRIIRVEVKCPI